MESTVQKTELPIHVVTSCDSPEFAHLSHALTHSSVIGLDAEWKPNRRPFTFPMVCLLQIACRLAESDSDESPVFLVDLQSIHHLPPVYELFKQVFVAPSVIKIGFSFKQDLVFLSYTFCERGCDPGFDIVEPFIDINAIYNHLQTKQPGPRITTQTKGLATICEELLGISVSKELQCSDWSQRPLTEEQKAYAAADARYLVEIFKVFYAKVVGEGKPRQISEISNMNHITLPELQSMQMTEVVDSMKSCYLNNQVDNSLSWIVWMHGDKIMLNDSERKPGTPKMKAKKFSTPSKHKQKTSEIAQDWQDLAPWDPSLGGDGCPKFLCDVMVAGLAKYLRGAGIDTAIPHLSMPDTRNLMDQAQKEMRVVLTRDVELLRHVSLIKNQTYCLKSHNKKGQLHEVIRTFRLKTSEDPLVSRCINCNGKFIQKPLTAQEAVEAATGVQAIPNFLFKKYSEFWQCMDCNYIFWKGNRCYGAAVQKFDNLCNQNEMEKASSSKSEKKKKKKKYTKKKQAKAQTKDPVPSQAQ